MAITFLKYVIEISQKNILFQEIKFVELAQLHSIFIVFTVQAIDFNYLYNSTDKYALFLILIPLNFKLTSILLRRKYIKILSELPQNITINLGNRSNYDLDYILRIIYDFSKINYEDYINNSSSIQECYLNYIHKIGCKLKDNECFCQKKLDPLDTFQEKQQQKQLCELLSSYYRTSYASIKNNQFDQFGLLYFMIDICKNIQTSTILAYQMYNQYSTTQNKRDRESSFNQQIYYQFTFRYLPQKSQEHYIFNLTKASQSKQSENVLNEQIDNIEIYEKEYQQLNDQTQKLQLIQSIIYEEKEMDVSQEILKCIVKKNEMLNFLLYSQTIALSQLQQKLMDLKQVLNKVNISLKQLINLNPFNILLPQLVDVMETEFCIDRKLFKYLKKAKKIFSKKDHSNLKIKQYIKQTIELTTLTDSCILFLSLIEKNPFIVKKATQNYADLLNWTDQKTSLIGQSINILMPPVIARYHDEVINKYFFKSQNYKEVSKTLDVIDSRQQIGIDGQGWAVPYLIQYQLTVLSDSEIGICSRIERQYEYSDCLIADAQTFEIIAISENLQIKLLEENNGLISIKNIKINKIITELEQFLNMLDKNNLECGLLEAILTKPSYQTVRRQSLFKKTSSKEVNISEDSQKYILKADCIYKKSAFKRIIQLKVITLRLLNNIQESQVLTKKRLSYFNDEKKVIQNNAITTENSFLNIISGSQIKLTQSPVSRFVQQEVQDDDLFTLQSKRFQSYQTDAGLNAIYSNQDTFINSDRVFSNNNLIRKQSDVLKIQQIMNFEKAETEGKHKMSEHDEEERNAKFHQSETRSRQTEMTYNKFKIMAKNIHSTNQILGLKLINIFGYLFFIVILILSVVNYNILNNAFVEQQNEVLNLDWPQQVQNSLQQEVVDLTFQKLTADQYFINNLYQPNENSALMPRLQAQMKNQLKLLKNYILKHLLITYPTQDVENKILSQRVDYQFETKINQYVKVESTSIYRIEHIVYFMLESVFTIQTNNKQYIQSNDALIIDNFENLQASYTDIKYAMENAIQLKFQQLLNHAKITFYTILCFAIIFFIFFIIIYSYIQNKRNRILKGISFFGQSSLIQMIDQNKQKQKIIEEILNISKNPSHLAQFKKQIETLKSNQLNLQKQQFEINQKQNVRRSKKIINLKRFSILLTLICLLNLSLVQLYSFASFVTVESFLNLLSQERSFLDVMSSVQVAMNRSAGYTPKLLLLKIHYPEEFYYYYNKYKKEIAQNIQLNQQHYDQYLQQQYVKRNNQTLFMYYIDGLYKYDACNMTQQFATYVTGGGFNLTDCNLVINKIFSQGIIQGITFFYEYLQQQFDLIALQDLSQFMSLEKNLINSFTFYQQNQFRLNLQQIFSASKKFVRYQIQGDYAYMISSNYFYFVLQMVIICTIFIFIWITFFTYFKKQYILTKQTLDVFDLYSLANNKKLYSQFYKIK
ncbi:transmembrane protein, putative (macronuclear) [Tetrahymena thermophila SB210]|uniref:Transmembrane protein, putative n=1 Tax=Tetrahymena thermophila (strain SB210) TaxID=312017 RepID=I7MDF2_TETTS|nr:transmembrane protein, putative [Tetrahymena thermophila SB210]EAR87474.2 transmembrane protein, putative [Tetrahymena thermophila SB210]|eukprot:XP_001007719.2 transmembrane protein, putative [Tetrahymena thermophila SB210]